MIENFILTKMPKRPAVKVNRNSAMIMQINFLNFTVKKPLVNSLLSSLSGAIFCISQ